MNATRKTSSIAAALAVTAVLPLAGLVFPVAAATPVPSIHSGSAPSGGTETLQLEELWRRGGEDDLDVLFGVITQVAVDSDGSIYLLDAQLSHVEVFSPDGEHLATLSREGDGPGETRRPGDMVLTAGGQLGLAQAFPGKLVLIERDGTPAGQIEVGPQDPSQGGFNILRRTVCGGGNLVLGAVTVGQGEGGQGTQTRRPTIASYGPGGERLAVYHESEYGFDFTSGTFTFDESAHLDIPLRRFAVGPDGRVYVAPDREKYLIEVYEPDGTLVRTIGRDYAMDRRTAEETSFWEDLFTSSMRNIPLELQMKMCDTEAPIDWVYGGLTARQDGSLWVRTSRSGDDRPPGVMLTYDVFDSGGHFAKQVAVACAGDPDEDALFFAGPDRMILVTGFLDAVIAMIGGGSTGDETADEPAPMEVVCYAIH